MHTSLVPSRGYKKGISGTNFMMKKLVNLTPHPIVVLGPDGEITIPASGTVARCSEVSEVIGELNGVPVIRKSFGQVVNLPEPEEGVVYIVSALVAQAAKDRDDVVFPGNLVRDDQGNIKGLNAFGKI